MSARGFQFRPRYRGVAWVSMGIGGSIAVVAAVLGLSTVPLASGVLGIALGVSYLALPTWRITVTVDDRGLTVGSPGRQRFHLPWSDVVRVVASPSTHTCFVDGGKPEHSLLVPGVGAPAPYDITDKQALVEAILAHVPAGKVQIVESLEAAQAQAPAPPPA